MTLNGVMISAVAELFVHRMKITLKTGTSMVLTHSVLSHLPVDPSQLVDHRDVLSLVPPVPE